MDGWTLTEGDCVEVMAQAPAACADAICTDPPYGLEFMGKEWDRLTPDSRGVGSWATGSTATGYADAERLERPSFGSSRNPVCRTCHKHQRGTDRCQCPESDFDQRPADANRLMQEWHERWAREALRVLKPGGHLLAFGGTRTAHRLACALEDAGFEIRDTIVWMYGSGFPKSLDVSKAIDKAAGAERTEVVGVKPGHEDFIERTDAHSAGGRSEGWDRDWRSDPEAVLRSHQRFAAATPEAEQWEGWGTALKPAHEPIIVARKPLAGTVATNVLEHGTGALNIDGCRVGYESGGSLASNPSLRDSVAGGNGGHIFATEAERRYAQPHAAGRWPANVALSHAPDCKPLGTRRIKAITGTASGRMGENYQSGVYGGYTGNSDGFGKPTGYGDEDGYETVETWDCAEGCPIRMLDEQTGVLKSGDGNVRQASGADRDGNRSAAYGAESRPAGTPMVTYGDEGGASRFFYCAKADRAERNTGLDGPEKPLLWSSGTQNPGSFQAEGTNRAARNNHPTVKPIDLMRWLVRLVTPPGGLVLDPFAGSGTTGIAALLEGFRFAGIERDGEYVKLATARLEHWARYPAGTPTDTVVAASVVEQRVADAGQLSIFDR